MHRAGAALAVIATFLRARESNGLADAIQQRRARINAKMVVLSVNAQRDRDSAVDAALIRDFPGWAALRASSFRVRRAADHDCGCRTTSHGPQKIPPGRI